MYEYSGLSFQHLQYFITIVECGTMSKAADLLHVSPSLLSQKIAQLESIIGIQLFQRSRQRLSLTEAGRQLVIDFKDIFSQLNYVLDSAREQYCHTHTLTIGFNNYLSQDTTEVFVNEFRKAHQNKPFAVEIQPRTRLQTDFQERKIDIISTIDLDRLRADKSVICRIVCMLPISCHVSALGAFSKKVALSWKELDGATCTLPEHQKSSTFVRDLKRKLNEENVDVTIKFHSGDIMTIDHLIAHSDCITFAGMRAAPGDRVKSFSLQGLEYPYLVAYHGDAGKDVIDCAQTLYQTICKNSALIQP